MITHYKNNYDDLKVYSYLLCIIISATIKSNTTLLVILMFSIGRMIFIRMSFRYFFRRFKYIVIFGGGLLLLPLPFTKGIDYTIWIALKFFISVLSCLSMVYEVKVDKIFKALEKIKVPKLIIDIISFNIRYINVIRNEVKRMHMAKISRSYGQKKVINIKDLKEIANMLSILFIRSYYRSNRIYKAMKSRGFREGES